MPAWGNVFQVDGEEECEAEEGDDDEIDQADGDGGGDVGGAEGAEVDGCEANCRGKRLGGFLKRGEGDAAVLGDGSSPLDAELCSCYFFEGGELGNDVGWDGVLISG